MWCLNRDIVPFSKYDDVIFTVGSKIIGTPDQQCRNNTYNYREREYTNMGQILYFNNVSTETTKIITII